MEKKTILLLLFLLLYVTEIYPQSADEMVAVQGGTFSMGCSDGRPDEKPPHDVTLGNFQISKYEITNQQYAAFLNENGNQSEDGVPWIDLNGSYIDIKCRILKDGENFTVESGYENHPVVFVTWYGARAYANWKGGRLPTEAQWEFAARGGNQSQNFTYSGSDTPGEVAWFMENAQGINAVGQKTPNKLGIYDMSGNVYEWCRDWYDETYYGSSDANSPTGPNFGTNKVLRGGMWDSSKNNIRVCKRKSYSPNANYDSVGFRIVIEE